MAALNVSRPPQSISKPDPIVQARIRELCKEGETLMKKDDRSGALRTFKKAFIISCHHSDNILQKTCLFNLGAVYIGIGKPQKALKCLIKSRNHGGDGDGDLYFNIAVAYDEMKEYGKAVKFYEKAINEYSTEDISSIADALIKLGYCFTTVGELFSAAHSFRLAGHSYLKNQRLEDAAMAMREAAKYMIKSQAFAKTEVLQTLNLCVQSLEGVSDKQILGTLYNHVGLHYAEIKCFSQAEKCFTESLNLCSGKHFSIRKMAVLLQNLGAVDNALNQFEKSLRSHAEAADMYASLGERNAQGQCMCNLAFAYSQLRNYDMAEFYYLQALQAFVEAGDALRQCHVSEGLGATYFCLGNLDQAIHYYKKALALSGQLKETPNGIADRILGKLTDAIEYKVARRHRAPNSESVTRRKSRQSPSNCANDDCKSVTSQYHESCVQSDGTLTDSSYDEDLLKRSLRRDKGNAPFFKLKQPKSNEQDVLENETTHQYETQTKVSESKSSTIPAKDEQSQQKSMDPKSVTKATENNKSHISENEEELEQRIKDQGHISPSERNGTCEPQRKRYNTEFTKGIVGSFI
ncbi:uncharacterized protein PAF06_009744 [Gastrophryne carolinensis]